MNKKFTIIFVIIVLVIAIGFVAKELVSNDSQNSLSNQQEKVLQPNKVKQNDSKVLENKVPSQVNSYGGAAEPNK